MNQANVKVSFYLKKSEVDADGNCPVMAKLNVGKYSEAAFSVKIKVPQSRWSSGRASGKSVAAKEINNRLDEIRAMALNIYMEQSAVRDGVTAEEVKGILLGMASGQETLLGYFRRFIRNFEKRVGINRTVGSLRAYSNAYSHIERFLQAQHNNPAIPAGHARSTPSRATARTPGRFHWPADWPPHVRSSSRSLPSCVFVFCVRHRLQSGRRITFQCHVPSPMVVARAPAVTPSRIRPHPISSSHPAKVPSQGRHMGLSPDEGSRRGTDIRS